VNDVVLDINMFSSAMEFRVFDKTRSTLVVGELLCRRGGGFTKAGEKPSMRNNLLGGRGGNKIL
jgi:hypothetical protein